jgi:hypothetical protein
VVWVGLLLVVVVLCLVFVLRRIRRRVIFLLVVGLCGVPGGFCMGIKEMPMGEFFYAFPRSTGELVSQLLGFLVGALVVCLVSCVILWYAPITSEVEDDCGPTCQHCGYSLRGLVENRCPECGKEF